MFRCAKKTAFFSNNFYVFTESLKKGKGMIRFPLGIFREHGRLMLFGQQNANYLNSKLEESGYVIREGYCYQKKLLFVDGFLMLGKQFFLFSTCQRSLLFRLFIDLFTHFLFEILFILLANSWTIIFESNSCQKNLFISW